jgi:hypothetical protein
MDTISAAAATIAPGNRKRRLSRGFIKTLVHIVAQNARFVTEEL